MPTDDEEYSASFAARLEEHRRAITSRIRSMVSGADLVLFDGEVMSSDAATERFHQLRRRHLVLLVEVVGVLAVLGAIAFFAWQYLIDLAG